MIYYNQKEKSRWMRVVYQNGENMKKNINKNIKKISMTGVILACSMAVMVGCNSATTDNANDNDSNTSEVTSENETDVKEDNETNVVEDTSAVEILQKSWDLMAEDNKFPVFGGSIENSVDGAAGEVKIDDANMLTNTLLVPEDVQKVTVEAASLVHMMNTNTFTGATIKVDGMDADEAADKVLDSFMSTAFVCGVPEKITIVVYGDYITYAYGETDLVDSFIDCYNANYVATKVIDKKY